MRADPVEGDVACALIVDGGSAGGRQVGSAGGRHDGSASTLQLLQLGWSRRRTDEHSLTECTLLFRDLCSYTRIASDLPLRILYTHKENQFQLNLEELTFILLQSK